MGTTFVLRQNGTGLSGCGLLLRQTGDTHYMVAYLDNSGAYGVSERTGDAFMPGIYGENVVSDTSITNELLVVVSGNILHYFINGHHVDTMEINSIEGEVGNVLVNFEPVDSYCEFTNTWLWKWN